MTCMTVSQRILTYALNILTIYARSSSNAVSTGDDDGPVKELRLRFGRYKTNRVAIWKQMIYEPSRLDMCEVFKRVRSGFQDENL